MRRIALAVGTGMTALGVAGFVPVCFWNDLLFGVLAVDTTLNFIHLVTGLSAFAALLNEKERAYFEITGIVYALLSTVGLMSESTVLGAVPIHAANSVFHLSIALMSLYVGFGSHSVSKESDGMEAVT